MKNRKFWYIVITCIAGLLVTFSVLMPGILLNRAEESILGSPSTISDGTSSSQQRGSPVASTPPTQTPKTVEQLTRSVQLFEQSASNSVLSKEATNGSLNIKEAVDACVKQITTLLQKGALPPLDKFPQSYSVKAELRAITDGSGNPALQYWDILFDAGADQTTIPANPPNLAVSLDAQTNLFLSIGISVGNTVQVNLVTSAQAIAQGMNIPGEVFSLNQQQDFQRALWKVKDSSLLMQLTLKQSSQLTSFTMAMSTNRGTPVHAASNQQKCTTSPDNKVKACISRTSTGGIVTSYHIDCDGTTSKDGGAVVINEVKNGVVDPAHGNNGGGDGTEVKCGDGNGPSYTTSAPGTSYSSTVTAWFDNGGFDSIDSPRV